MYFLSSDNLCDKYVNAKKYKSLSSVSWIHKFVNIILENIIVCRIRLSCLFKKQIYLRNIVDYYVSYNCKYIKLYYRVIVMK